MSETGEVKTTHSQPCWNWTFDLSVRSRTIVWTKEMVELLRKALDEIPDIDSYAITEAYRDV